MELPKIITQLQKPLQKKRKLYVLVIVLVLLLGGIGAAYYFHLESERERLIGYKTRQLDNYFQKLTRKLDNDLLIVRARDPETKEKEENTLLELKSYISKLNLKKEDTLLSSKIQSTIDKYGLKLKIDTQKKLKNSEEILTQIEDLLEPKSNSEESLNKDPGNKSDCNFVDGTTRQCLEEFIEKQLNVSKDFDEYILKIFNKNVNDLNYGSSFSGLNEKQLIIGIEKDESWVTKKENLIIDHQEYLILGKRFSYKPDLINEFDITLYGLVTTENFRQEVGQIDPAIVALLVTVLIMLVIGLPFLKLVFISEDERLLSSDALFAGLSTILGAPVLLILLLSTFYYYRDFDQKNEELKSMAESLKSKFEKENGEIVERASTFQYDQYRNENDLDFRYVSEDSNEQIIERNNTLFKEAKFLYNIPLKNSNIYYFKYVSEIYSSDSIINKEKKDKVYLIKEGDVRYHVNYMAKPPAGKAPWNLSNRIYFKDLKTRKNVWNKDGINYVMRPVVSIENSAEEAVYALETTNEQGQNTMGIFAVQLKSLHSASLPIGYKFAVVNDIGEVWFHSQKGKSTLENLFSNSTDDEKLESAITGRIKAEGTFNYHGERQLYSTLPITGTNLSIITFYDVELIGLHITEVLSITTILFLIIAIFMAVVVSISVFLKNPKWGLYKFYSFPFQFLLPKRKFLKAYHFLAVFFTVLFILLSVVEIGHESYSFNYLLGVVIIYWSYMLSYHVLRAKKEENQLNLANILFLVISILLNLLIVKLVHISDFIYVLVGVQSLFLLPILLSYTNWFKSFIYPEDKLSSASQSKNIKYKYSYVNFLAVWLFSSTLMPAFIFFENSKHINDTIWQRANLYEYLNHRQNKEELLKKNILKPIYKNKIEHKNKIGYEIIKSRFGDNIDVIETLKTTNDSINDKEDWLVEEINFIKKLIQYNKEHDKLISSNLVEGNYFPKNDSLNIYYNFKENIDIKTETEDNGYDTIINQLVWHIRPIYKERSRLYQHFSQRQSEDRSWISFRENDTIIKFQLNPNKKEKELLTVSYINKNETYRFINLFYTDEKRYAILNLFGTLIIFGSFYWLILFYVDRCFAFRFFYLEPSKIDKKQSDGKSYAEKLFKLISTSKGNSGLFMIGLPSTGKQTFAENILEDQAYRTLSCSLISTCSKDDDIKKVIQKIVVNQTTDNQELDSTYVILQNFEHNLLSFEENHIKIKLISYLIGIGSKIVITSEIYPNQLLDVYRDQVDQSGELKADLAADYNSWRDILGRFHQILLGITKNDALISKSLGKVITKYEEGTLDLLKSELGHSKYLPALSPVLLKKCTYSKIKDGKAVFMIDNQRIVLHAMMTAHGYYTDIWNSLPRREKYILFDLAKDGFMNIKNSISLFSLMKKGLIVWDDIPRVFNKSFRNFIISNGEKDIVLSKERRNTGGQNWGTTKIILMVIIMAIIVFIVIGNPGIVKNLESFIGALAGLGALIPILSSLLGKSRKSE